MDFFPDKSIFPIAFGFILLAFYWSTGVCMNLIFLVFAAIAGYFLSHFLLKNPNYCRSLQFIYANFIYRNETNLSNKTKPNILENRKNTQPWDQIKLDALLNRELEQFFETIIENYVNNWYTELSGDASFLLEIRHLLRHTAARIISTITESDLQRILIDDIFPIIITHVDRICRITNEQFPDSIPGSAHMPSSLVEMKILEKWPDPHWATISSENQANYLRAISDALICKFVDDVRIGGCFVDEEHHRWLDREGAVYATKWSCNSSRHFLRELLFSTILLPTIDYFSDPDSLNQLVLSLINDTPEKDSQIGKSNESNKKEDFLLTFADKMYNHSPDTLLGLKLIDIVRDVNLIRNFELYIRDLNGPVNYLDCFLQTRDILMKIQNINNMQSGRSTKRHEQEIYSDSWQLYSTFIHQNSSNYLQIKEQIVNEFSNVIDQKSGSENLKLLEHVIESIYQEIYQFLQYNYAIPFCQSENFLGYLIGAPIYANDFIGNEEFSTQKSQKIPEKSFTLSQFRKKLFNFVVPSKDRQNSTSTFYPSLSSSDLERLAGNEDHKLTDFDLESGTISLCDMARDLNKWTVGIQGIEERREMTVKGQFLFSLVIERNDLPEEYYSEKSVEMSENDVEDEMNEKLPRIWTIGHKYEEFYALEDKLRNYYGNGLRMPPLPERKGTLELLRISSQQRTLMESHRPQFERFIQQLLQQHLLRRSDLLYIFLTSDEDNSGIFELIEENDGSNFMTDLNPIRAMRKVAKGERGENLRPFILNSLAKVLSPLTKPCSSMRHQQLSHSLSFDSKESSISRKLDEADDNRPNSSSSNRNKKTSNLLNQNFIPRANETHESVNKHIFWKSNFYDIFLFLLTTLKIFRLPVWFEALCCSGKYFVDYIFALIFHKKMKEILKQKFLNVETATIIVKILHDLVLPPQQNITNPSSLSATPSQMSIDSSSAPFKKSQQLTAKPQTKTAVSEQERHLRAELLLHCLEKRAEGLLPYSRIFSWLVNASSDSINEKTGSLCKTTAILQLFFCFQMPLLNRELAFVLLDIFLERILLIPKLKS